MEKYWYYFGELSK